MSILSYSSQILFFCPILSLHLRRINSIANCIFCCIKQDKKERDELSFFDDNDDDENSDDDNEEINEHESFTSSTSSNSTSSRQTNMNDNTNSHSSTASPTKKIKQKFNMNHRLKVMTAKKLTSIQKNDFSDKNNENNEINEINETTSTQLKSQDNMKNDDINIHLDSKYSNRHRHPKKKNKSFLKKIKKVKFLSFLNNTFIRYFVFVLFFVYLAGNVAISVDFFLVDFNFKSILPKDSYIYDHKLNIEQTFNLSPVIIVTFARQLDYWNPDVSCKIRSFLDEAKSLEKVNKTFEINWLEEVIGNIKLSREYNRTEFYNAFQNVVMNSDIYRNDVTLNNTPSNITITSSRFYIKLFPKCQNDYSCSSNVMRHLHNLAKSDKYFNDNRQTLFFTSDKVYIEHHETVLTSLIIIVLITSFVSALSLLIFCFDIKSAFFIFIMTFSLFISVISGCFLFSTSLNVVTLSHFIALPAYLGQFFLVITYLYLYKIQSFRQRIPPEYDESDMRTPRRFVRNVLHEMRISLLAYLDLNINDTWVIKRKYQQLVMAFDLAISQTTWFLFLTVILSISLMYFCESYYFHSMFIFLTITHLNLFLHLRFFYPIFLSLFGIDSDQL
jgi:hypothetical protein